MKPKLPIATRRDAIDVCLVIGAITIGIILIVGATMWITP